MFARLSKIQWAQTLKVNKKILNDNIGTNKNSPRPLNHRLSSDTKYIGAGPKTKILKIISTPPMGGGVAEISSITQNISQPEKHFFPKIDFLKMCLNDIQIIENCIKITPKVFKTRF